MSGIGCPSCGAKAEVVETRPGDGYIRRRRVCACGTRFATRETIWVDPRPKTAKPPRGKRGPPMMTYLTAEQKVRAKAFLAAGWKVGEVAKLYDMTATELRR